MKTIVTILALGFAHLCLAQNVPNGDFENWDTEEEFSPTGYTSVGLVSKTNDSKTGGNALRLENRREGGNSYFGAITNSDFEEGFGFGGIPYEDRPLSLKFWAKYDLTKDDKSHIICYFKLKNAVIGIINFTIEGSSNDQFLEYSVPITWYGTGIPDSVTFFASSNSLYTSFVRGNGYIIFDDMHFATINNRNQELTNGDYESWDTTGIATPMEWFTTGDFLRKEEGDDFGLQFVSKVDNGRTGSAVKMRNINVDNQAISGVIMTHDDFDNFLSPSFDINKNWKYLEGYYKYRSDGGDSASLAVGAFNNTTIVGGAEYQIGKQASDWTYFAIPLQYFSTANKATLIIASSDPDNPKGDSSELWLDDLRFVDWTASVDKAIVNKVFIYPNPAQDYVQISLENNDVACVSVLAADGRLLQKVQSREQEIQLNIQQLKSGLYYLRIEQDGTIQTKKLNKI